LHGGGGGSWLTLIGWASGYQTVGSFLVRPSANDPPVANADAFTLDEDGTLNGDVLLDNGAGADSPGDEPTTVAAGTVAVANGSLTLNPDGTFVYTPAPGFNGSDSFSYTLTDSTPETSAEATVSITVTAVNQAPLVTAGLNTSIILPMNIVALNGTASDDGLPAGTLMTGWSHIGGTGTGTVTFADPAAPITSVTFSSDPGTYLLRLTADDSELVSSDDTAIILSNSAPVTGITPVNYTSTGFNTATNMPLTIPSIDPAGLVYHEPSGRLIIADAEINEVTAAFNIVQANLFEIDTAGSALFNQWDLTQRTGNEPSMNNEPTGIAFCANDAHFYVSNDDNQLIYRYAYDGSDFTAVDSVSTQPHTNDPEGVTCDPATGRIYVIGGLDINIVVYDYNAGFVLYEVLDLVSTAGTPSGIPSDPEGIAFDPVSGHLFVVSEPDGAIFEYTTDGIFIKKLDLSSLSPASVAPQGLAVGTSSVNPQKMSFYISDGGIDNDQDPNERDGRIYEMEIQRTP
jgi:hypothetical protein